MLRHYFHATEQKAEPELIDGTTEDEQGYYLGALDTTDSYRIVFLIVLYHYLPCLRYAFAMPSQRLSHLFLRRCKLRAVGSFQVRFRSVVSPFLGMGENGSYIGTT